VNLTRCLSAHGDASAAHYAFLPRTRGKDAALATEGSTRLTRFAVAWMRRFRDPAREVARPARRPSLLLGAQHASR